MRLLRKEFCYFCILLMSMMFFCNNASAMHNSKWGDDEEGYKPNLISANANQVKIKIEENSNVISPDFEEIPQIITPTKQLEFNGDNIKTPIDLL